MEEGESTGAARAGETPENAETDAGGERGPAPLPPTPVRAAMGPASTPAAESAVPAPETICDAEGVRWVVRALGHSGPSRTSLLLLGFFHPDDPGEHRRESLVVARALEHLTELQLEAAWRAGGPPVQPGTRRPFFPEIVARGGKEG